MTQREIVSGRHGAVPRAMLAYGKVESIISYNLVSADRRLVHVYRVATENESRMYAIASGKRYDLAFHH